MSVSKPAEVKREIVRMPLDWFKPGKNHRQQFDEDDLWRLNASLKKGQAMPVIAFPQGSLIEGERRWRAACLDGIPAALDTIIIEGPISDSELRRIQSATVFHKQDLTPGEKYELVYELVQLNPSWQEKEVAEYLDIHISTVSKLLSFGKNIPPVRQALKDGLLSINEGHAFSSMPEPDQTELLRLRLAGEILNREEMLAEVKARKTAAKNGHSKPDMGRFRAPMPSGVMASFCGPMKCVSDLQEAARELVKQTARAIKDGVEDLKAFEVWLKARDGRN